MIYVGVSLPFPLFTLMANVFLVINKIVRVVFCIMLLLFYCSLFPFI